MPKRQAGRVTRVDADVLIPGAGPPLTAATVLTDGETISYAGPRRGPEPRGAGRAEVRVPDVMPGRREYHCHLHDIRRFALEGMVPARRDRSRDWEQARAPLARKRPGPASCAQDSTLTCWPWRATAL